MRVLVALSLLLNAFLAVTLMRAPASATITESSRPVRTNILASHALNRQRRASAPPAAANPWQSLAAGDYRSLVAQLRAAGCPDETIRDLVVLRLARETRERLIAGEMEFYVRTNWWRNPVTYAESVQMQRAQRHARVQMHLQFEELLGVPAIETARDMIGFQTPTSDSWLASEKRRDFALLLNRFEDEDEEIRQGRRGHGIALTSVQRRQLSEMRQQQRAELALFLSPAELHAYDLRYSDAAKYVLQTLPAARTEAEFAKMVKVAQEMNAVPRHLRDDLDPFEQRELRRSDAEEMKLVMEKFKAALGTEAVASFEQAQAEQEAQKKAEQQERDRQDAMKELTKMAQAAGLDVSLAPKFYDRLMAVAKESKDQNDGSRVTEEQRKETQAKAKALFETIAVEVFGERGRELVKQMDKKMDKKGR